MKVHKTTGIALAVAAAGLFSMAPIAVSAGSDSEVKCFGVNKCKGHNDCKTANNACKGKNSCKGQGFVNMSEEACEKVGGKTKSS
ncbi:MAG: hypothetical protein LJE85_01275 [Gammaproteobacteria bacterium]|nr:hypothetical protein [Gammaproteobacteria bacterium]